MHNITKPNQASYEKSTSAVVYALMSGSVHLYNACVDMQIWTDSIRESAQGHALYADSTHCVNMSVDGCHDNVSLLIECHTSSSMTQSQLDNSVQLHVYSFSKHISSLISILTRDLLLSSHPLDVVSHVVF